MGPLGDCPVLYTDRVKLPFDRGSVCVRFRPYPVAHIRSDDRPVLTDAADWAIEADDPQRAPDAPHERPC